MEISGSGNYDVRRETSIVNSTISELKKVYYFSIEYKIAKIWEIDNEFCVGIYDEDGIYAFSSS